jgi:hemolysin D
MRVGDTDMPLGPGMTVQAEIKTGTRRIIQYLLSPIMKTVEEAGRER